jgi:hypothetical protein
VCLHRHRGEIAAEGTTSAGLSPDRETRYESVFGSDGTQRAFGEVHGSQDEF